MIRDLFRAHAHVDNRCENLPSTPCMWSSALASAAVHCVSLTSADLLPFVCLIACDCTPFTAPRGMAEGRSGAEGPRARRGTTLLLLLLLLLLGAHREKRASAARKNVSAEQREWSEEQIGTRMAAHRTSTETRRWGWWRKGCSNGGPLFLPFLSATAPKLSSDCAYCFPKYLFIEASILYRCMKLL